MLIEARYNGIFREQAISFADVIAIGSEKCVYGLPASEELREQVQQIHSMGKQVRLVTPKTPEESFDRVLNVIKEALELQVDKITVNDYGILYAIKEFSTICESEITLGRGVSWCMEECPWYENLLRDESEFIVKTCLMSNMENNRKLDLLVSMGVNSIEVEGFNGVLKNMDIIRGKMKVLIHSDYPVISFSRACHSAKFRKETIGECYGNCNKLYKLEIDKGYNGKTPYPHFAEVSDKAKNIMGNLYVSGNLVYAPKVNINDVSDYIREEDTIILNMNMLENNEVCELLNTFEKKVSI